MTGEESNNVAGFVLEYESSEQMNVLNLHISSCLLGVCALICNDMNAKRNGGVYTDMKFAEGDNSTF